MHPTIERSHHLIEQAGQRDWQMLQRRADRDEGERDSLENWGASMPAAQPKLQDEMTEAVRRHVAQRLEAMSDMIGEEIGFIERRLTRQIASMRAAHEQEREMFEARILQLEEQATRP